MSDWRYRQRGSIIAVSVLIPLLGLPTVVGLVYLTDGWIVVAFVVGVALLLVTTFVSDFFL